jgi:hypothetical protein
MGPLGALRSPKRSELPSEPCGRWAAETNPIPDNLPAELAALCRQRAADLIKQADQLEGRS